MLDGNRAMVNGVAIATGLANTVNQKLQTNLLKQLDKWTKELSIVCKNGIWS